METALATEASNYLTTVARRMATELVARTAPRAILLTGSVAEGTSDRFSDVDLIAYYETLPSAGQLAAVQTALQAANSRKLAGQEAESFIEQFTLHGVTCQVAHLTIAAWERDMASVLEKFEPATVTEKALSGLLAGVPLHGSDVIGRWQARAAHYPDELARATVERHLHVFPLWIVAESWQTRDATIFYFESLVTASLNLLAVLAGLNRLYFSSFQFKRLHQFAGKMRLAPERLAERLNALFALDPIEAGLALERLIAETVALVETHMPEIDTAPLRAQLGVRHQPWEERPHASGPSRTGGIAHRLDHPLDRRDHQLRLVAGNEVPALFGNDEPAIRPDPPAAEATPPPGPRRVNGCRRARQSRP